MDDPLALLYRLRDSIPDDDFKLVEDLVNDLISYMVTYGGSHVGYFDCSYSVYRFGKLWSVRLLVGSEWLIEVYEFSDHYIIDGDKDVFTVNLGDPELFGKLRCFMSSKA